MKEKTPPVQVAKGGGGPGTSIDWHVVGDHYECKYSVGASSSAQVGAGCSNRYVKTQSSQSIIYSLHWPSAPCKKYISSSCLVNIFNTLGTFIIVEEVNSSSEEQEI